MYIHHIVSIAIKLFNSAQKLARTEKLWQEKLINVRIQLVILSYFIFLFVIHSIINHQIYNTLQPSLIWVLKLWISFWRDMHPWCLVGNIFRLFLVENFVHLPWSGLTIFIDLIDVPCISNVIGSVMNGCSPTLVEWRVTVYSLYMCVCLTITNFRAKLWTFELQMKYQQASNLLRIKHSNRNF